MSITLAVPRVEPTPASSIQPATAGEARKHLRPELRSCLYECRVLHHRLTPREHRFVYRLFYFCFDLDELPVLQARLRWLSVNRINLLSFRERDFLPTVEPLHQPTPGSPVVGPKSDGSTLKSRVVAFCAAHGVMLGPQARVQLITLPRLFGHHFNPVSFYFCFDGRGAPRAAIAEVTNTFKEVKPYFIPLDDRASSAATFRLRVPKHFYVSPFSDPGLEFDFALRVPAGKLAFQIDDHAEGHRVLHSTLTGDRAMLTEARLAWFLFKYPLITLKIISLIHWQALRLWLKGVPFFGKAAHPTRQRDLYRPHSSIADDHAP